MQVTSDDARVRWLAAQIPDPVRGPKGGRPPMDKVKALMGIFWILDNGAKWKSLPPEYGSKSAVHRHFQRWVEDGVFRRVIESTGRLMEEREGFKLYECFIDGTFSKAKGGGDGVGVTKVGKGMKIMMLVDANGLPVAVDSGPAGPAECKLVQRLFDFMLTDRLPERVIGDKAYDSDLLDAQLAEIGVEMIAPHRVSRLPENKTQDGRALRRAKRRWKVERTISWLQNMRRLVVRYEKRSANFQALLQLACSLLLLTRVMG